MTSPNEVSGPLTSGARGAPIEAAHEYACAHCARKAAGRYIAGGWWQYPFGWLLHDDGARWVCGLTCALAASKRQSR